MEIKKTISMILVIAVLAGVAIGGWLFVNKQTKKKLGGLEKETRTIGKKEVALASPKSRKIDLVDRPRVEKNSSFYLQADRETYVVGETFNLRVIINGQGKVVDGAEFVLSFDPELVEIGEPVIGSFFSIYTQKIVDLENGTVKVIALQEPDENKKLSQETIVVLPVTVLQKGTAEFEFDIKKTHIAGYGGQELLEEAEGLKVVIQ